MAANDYEDIIDVYGTTVSVDGTEINGLDTDQIPVPESEINTKDVSTLKSGWVVKNKPAKLDPGTVDLAGFKIPGDPGQQLLKTAFDNRRLVTMTVSILPAGEIYTYDAYVTKITPESDDDSLKFSATLQAFSEVALETTYAGITSLVASGAGVMAFPDLIKTAFPATTNAVIINQATGISSCTITVTAATASSLTYSLNNGDSWVKLTSGTPSGSITLGDAGTVKELILKVAEESKATRFVKIYITKAAA